MENILRTQSEAGTQAATAAYIAKMNDADNQFWLQVMGDHARFILDALSYREAAEIESAKQMIPLLDGLLARAREIKTEQQRKELNEQAYRAVQDFRRYVLLLIRRQLSEKIILSLRPSFLNHIVNDAEQHLDALGAYMRNKVPVFDAASISMVWLTNMYVNALTMSDGLDATAFNEHKAGAMLLAQSFLDLYFKAFVINGLRRSGLDDFPSLRGFTEDVLIKMQEFAEYIVDLTALMEKKKILGNLTILYLDNMYRQLCYYLTKLSMVSHIKPPVCDPAAPRKE